MPSKPTSAARKQFGKRLAAARLAAGHATAEEFAKELGIEAPAYRKNERDGSLPKFEILCEIADLLECDLHWLITGVKLQRRGSGSRIAA